MSKHEDKIRTLMYDNVYIQAMITCTKCGFIGHTHNMDDHDSVTVFISEGWHATPTKAFCPICNPYKVIREKK